MDIFSKKNFKLKKKEKDNICNNNYYYNLTNYLDNVFINTDINKIYLCLYHIDSKAPILYYLLDDTLDFISINVNNNFKEYCDNYILQKFNKQYKTDGYKIYNNNIYLFYNILEKDSNSSDIWCVMDEICNKKKYLDMCINSNVTNLFLNHPNLIFLKNINNLKIEVPIVAFKNCEDEIELMYFKYKNKNNKYYDYDNTKKKYLLRYVLFLTKENFIFHKDYQYEIDYNCKPISVHK